MEKLANAVNRFASRVEPTYPFEQRPVVTVTSEPSITVRPFKDDQIRRLKALTEGPLKEALSTHFKGAKFEVRKEERVDGMLVARSVGFPPNIPSVIFVSSSLCEIELNFRLSACELTREDVGRHLAFIRQLLGKDASGKRKSWKHR